MRRDEALRILSEHLPELRAMGVQSVAIFGSTARDEAREDSDVDVLVEFADSAHVGLLKFAKIKQRLEAIMGRPVDLATPGMLRPPMRAEVIREAVHAA